MLILLSPAKTLDFIQEFTGQTTIPVFQKQALELINILKKMSQKQIAKLMDLSDNLAKLNLERYLDFAKNGTRDSLPAIIAFKGDVYKGLDADKFSKSDLEYASSHLRILSGLYGILKPLDLIKAHRLEMGTRLKNPKGNNLYKFWGDGIANEINLSLKDDPEPLIINLASTEYFKSVNTKILEHKVITPVFKEKKGNEYKMVMIFAKEARGMMASYIIKNRITKLKDLEKFNDKGYNYKKELSENNELVFVR